MALPMPPRMNAATDEAEPTEEAPAAEAQEPGGYTICIDVKPDNTFEVYKEAPEPAEATTGSPDQGDTGAPTPEPTEPPSEDRQSFDSLDEALKQVIRLHRQNPMDQSYGAQVSAGFQGEHQTPY